MEISSHLKLKRLSIVPEVKRKRSGSAQSNAITIGGHSNHEVPVVPGGASLLRIVEVVNVFFGKHVAVVTVIVPDREGAEVNYV